MSAQDGATLRDAYKANEVMDRMIAAYGGKGFLSGLKGVRVRLSGQTSARLSQLDPSPGGSPEMVGRSLDLTVDRLGLRYVYAATVENAAINSALNGSNSNFAFILTPDDRYLYFPKIRKATHGFAPPTLGGTTMIYIPHVVAAELMLDRAQVTWVGAGTLAGRPVDRLYYGPAIAGVRVFLVNSDGYIVGLEAPSTDPLYGDIVSRSTISGYHIVNGVAVPGRYTAASEHEVYSEYAYEEYDLDADIPDSAFAPPAGYEVIENIPFEGLQVREVADHVRMYGPAQTVIVELADEVVVFGLPRDDLAKIRELVGDKPIRVAIPSHHHGQHIGGLRAYVHAGIPIMTTSRNRDYFEKVATTHFALNPDAQSLEPREPVFEVVDDRRVFSDGTTRVEIINIGPVGHARDMYVAYLPDDGIVFTADLFEFNPEAIPPEVADYYRDMAKANLAALKRAVPGATTVIRSFRDAMPLSELEALIAGDGG